MSKKYNMSDLEIERQVDERIESKFIYINKVFNKKSKERFYTYGMRIHVRAKTKDKARDNIKLLIALVKMLNRTNKEELIEILGKVK